MAVVLLYSQVEVAVSVMLRLLSDCPPQQVPHLADALLSMVHTLLEQRVTRLQVLACNTVSLHPMCTCFKCVCVRACICMCVCVNCTCIVRSGTSVCSLSWACLSSVCNVFFPTHAHTSNNGWLHEAIYDFSFLV